MIERSGRIARLLACAVLATTSAACATITRGTTEAWTVNTVPPNAKVRTSNGFYCEATPCTFKMEHKATFDVTVTKPGYIDYHGHVMHQISAAGGAGMAGNVILGGVIGAGVDVATGAMMELKPNPLDVTLEPIAATVAQAPQAAPTRASVPDSPSQPPTNHRARSSGS